MMKLKTCVSGLWVPEILSTQSCCGGHTKSQGSSSCREEQGDIALMKEEQTY